MLKNELKKIFIKKYFMLIVAVFMIFEAVNVVGFLGGLFETNSDKERYTELVATYEGETNEGAKLQLEALYEKYTSAEGEKETLRKQLFSGEITGEQYEAETEKLKEYLSGRDIFLKFYEQCEFAFEDSANRHIVNAEFWNVIFGSEKLDFIYIISVILLTFLAVISENESNISEIKNTCQKGGAKLHILDNSICITYAILSSLFISVIRFVAAAMYFGSGRLNSPIQSLPLFENSRFDLTLFQLFLIITALKMLNVLLASSNS